MANPLGENMIRSPGRGRDEELCNFAELYKAVRDGKWNDTRALIDLESQPGDEAWNKIITDRGETALHVAVENGHEHIVEELVNRMSVGSLKMHDSDGYTALITAAVLGNRTMVECMLQKYHDLIRIRSNSEGEKLPVVMAIDFGQIEMARYLYDHTHGEDLIPQNNDQEIQDHNGATLFTRAISTGTLDIALRLIQTCPRLALALDKDEESPIFALASMRHSFPSGIQLGFCKQRFYSCMCIPYEPPTSTTTYLNVSNGEQRQSNQEDQNIISAPTNTETHLNVSNGEQRESNQEDQNIMSAPTNTETHLNVSNGEQCQSNQEDQNIISAPTSIETHLNISNGEQRQSNQEDQNIISVLSRSCAVGVLNLFGITQLYEMKKIHNQYNELLSHMCKAISESNTDQQLRDGQVYSAICRAAENGIFEFVSKMLETDRRFLWTTDRNGRNIFMLGVLHRQEKIFSILYSRETMKYNAMKCLLDDDGNNILHMAGMIEHSTRVNQIPGAALQMQRELQWFKEVERIVHPKDKETMNNDSLTPRQLFTKNHKNMMEKGEKWMKDTAQSCTVVGALIVTIMFAVAFTIPGGNNQDTGLPIFLNKKSFRVFMIFDALSFFLSSTSVLMFLGILTSRYTEDDFLKYLPRQMIIGLFTLFCSIVTMMITFASALLIILHEQSRIAIPLICLGGVPVTIFLWRQLPILTDMIISTYGPSIFDRKMKLKL